MADTVTKSWWQSKTVWAAIITALIGAADVILKQFGVDINSLPYVGAVLAILGALGIYGRVTATTTIK